MGNTRILRYIDLGNKMVDFVLVIFIDTPWEIWEMGNVGNMGSGKCPIHNNKELYSSTVYTVYSIY